ncbi:hypothetical protein GCM10022419_026440 [Nonomuraea rosea]|uniref:Uncharacterized protein n=1 Tax=Nonomuraea rosea TaxID=638574 RepID=A0ABP6W5M9_9ACTN
MSAEWAELDDGAWQLYGGLHRLLLRLAGRVPDELLTRARTMLAVGDLSYLPETVTMAALEYGVPLTAQELGLLREVFTALGIEGEPAGIDRVPTTDPTPDAPPTNAIDRVNAADPAPATGHRFSPDLAEPPRIPAGLDLTDGVPVELADLEDELFDLHDHLVVDALSEHTGVVAVLRAWRSGPGGRRRVYLAEVDPGVMAWELTLEAQTELRQLGEDDPQAEVYWTGDDLPPYHRAARAAATVLWKRQP